jgi:transposase-like protein
MTPAARLVWVRMYERTGDAGLTCRRCGISRPTLRKWWHRYRAVGAAGLEDRSRRPLRSPGRRVNAEQEHCILEMRRERRLGVKRLRNDSYASTGSVWPSIPSTRFSAGMARTASSGRA